MKETQADLDIRRCLDEKLSFHVIAGAGSGKTTSLVSALRHVRDSVGKRMRRDMQRVVCITYTKRAVAVIASRLGWDDLFTITTLHSFLWGEISRFATDIRRTLRGRVIPDHIERKRADDNGGTSKKAVEARERIQELEACLAGLDAIQTFTYGDSSYSDFAAGVLGHDDVIAVAAHLVSTSSQLRKVLGQKYPYFFVDEAQDTHENVVAALNAVCGGPGLPVVGYFGDPRQQIYDKRAGQFEGPPGAVRIAKEENFRCSIDVIRLLNAFRTDIQQFAAGRNAEIRGSVKLVMVQAESPSGPRGRYTDEQTDRASAKLDSVLDSLGWKDRDDVKHLYLVRQMIARRLGFTELHKMFTGPYSSSRSQDEYENGDHYLMKPVVESIYPLIVASRAGDSRAQIDVLRRHAPAFDPKGTNARRTLADMMTQAEVVVAEVVRRWESGTVGDLLRYCREQEVCAVSRRLAEALDRAPRSEPYDEETLSQEKGDWLADEYLQMPLPQVEAFCGYISEHTEFSTQHGVKGEEYERVLVVFDDIGAAWNNYSFSKTLTPATSGAPTDRQRRLSENLAYVCFSRAEVDLRIIMFSASAAAASQELINRGLFAPEQIVTV